MEGEIFNFIKVWVSVLISLFYCYTIRSVVPQGPKRLILVLPVVSLFFFLPLSLSSAHLGGTSAFFIAWLANFKLLLFAFGKGPLSSDPSIPFPLFASLACLPIKIQQKKQIKQNPPQKDNPIGKIEPSPPEKSNPNSSYTKEGAINYAVKALIFAILFRAYDYSDEIHPNVTLFLYAFHIYFLLEIILAVFAALARAAGLALEPQFNEPYLATSLQDFWGKRWNLMVTGILRPTVYEPALYASTRLIGRYLAPLPAVFATFVVSALMHELIFFYMGRVRPTWEITWFFLLHGSCLTAEIALKKALKGRWRLPSLISRMLTVGFVMSTGLWLFFPQFVRSKIDVKAFEEYAAVGALLRDLNDKIMQALTADKRS